ncbi:hypothetical protein BT96DRAFT_935860 [Gymnopus androsaceus JB14]|uniref:Uncharacterized protein n=1 Tax=Gymnopus androsaceus JB14 TaxID=1447944 RepID=A0A6A4I5K2_9AGAR|nr:hypothetical protein BT96DRAFT_935860 [Gymnopus androsaceus JB14]
MTPEESEQIAFVGIALFQDITTLIFINGLFGLVIVVIYTCANDAFTLFLVKFGLVVSTSGGLIAQEMAANLKATVTEILEDWSGNFIFLIADTAIVWRAWALWTDFRLVKWTLLIILLLDIGISIADATFDTRNIFSGNPLDLDWETSSINLCNITQQENTSGKNPSPYG